jgi:hypothetical protein
MYKGAMHTLRREKYYPPSEIACFYWLNNRRNVDWRNKQDDKESDDWTPPQPSEVTYKPKEGGASL